MTTVDWAVLVVIALFVLMGARSGLIVGFLSMVGFAVGALFASRLAPHLVPGGEVSPLAPLLALGGAVAGGAIAAAVFERIGAGLRAALPVPLLGSFDRLFGAIFGLAVGTAVAWLALLAVVQLPASDPVRRSLTRSDLLRALGSIMPPTDEVLGVIARLDPLPVVGGPSPALLPSPEDDPSTAGIAARVAGSVVKVRSRACGFSVEGSGWVGGSGLVVTNAHVVAGDQSPTVQQLGSDSARAARVVVFDRRNDIAILRVPEGGLTGLATAEPVPGSRGVLAGYPLDGGYRSGAVTVGRTVTVLGDDAYGDGPVTRRVEALRGTVRPGNSGGPVLDAQARVVGTVYGRTQSGSPRGGFAVPPDVVGRALERAKSGASDPTGPCAT